MNADNDRCICTHIRYCHAGGKCIHTECGCTAYQKANEQPTVEVEG